MSTSYRLSRSQAEKALCAYIKTALAADGVDAAIAAVPVQVRMGEFDPAGKQFVLAELDDLPLPSISIAAPKAEAHQMGLGVSIVDVHIMVCGGIDPGTEAESEAATLMKDQHEKITGFITALLADENLQAVLLALNKPATGPDNREIKDFAAFGFFPANEDAMETERHWIDDLVYQFLCQPTDDASL